MIRHRRGGRLHLAAVRPEVDQVQLLRGEIELLRRQVAEVTLERDDARLEVARLCMGKLLESADYVDCDRPGLQLVRGDDG